MTTATLFERLQAVKGVTVGIQPYLNEIDQDMQTRYGVSYSELAELVNPDGEMVKSAFDDGQSAKAFVDQTARSHYMLPVGAEVLNGGDAGKFNLVAAHISDYVGSRPDEWQRRDRGICQVVDDGFAILRPVKEANGSGYGFGIEVRIGGVLNANGYKVDDLGKPGERFSAGDLDEVLEKFEQTKALKFNAF
ncbi:hypothetical protein [Rhizobium sp. MHM7A]|uniref:hypothetical protein n=1 Tax=Rhizobium sp. MHM7A TaxID=2583233 RepID=UPI001105907B|nr:hypothetical protein [Rhizobium sp. MHM7A]TLX16932.1 hypothetical protein FFR93_06180 [Rhizobium sp. MHM7A]